MSILDEALLRDELARHIDKPWQLEFFPSLPSTNRYLCQEVSAGLQSRSHPGRQSGSRSGQQSSPPATEVRLCVTDQQTAGIGRRGRQWHSGNQSITFSVLHHFPLAASELGGLSLVAGIAIVEALETLADCQADLKWPNDVLVGGNKLAGILIEIPAATQTPCAVVTGIGINYASDLAQQSVDQPIATVSGCSATLVSREVLIAGITGNLLAAYDQFEKYGWSFFKDRYAKRDYLKEKTVFVHSGIVPVAKKDEQNTELIEPEARQALARKADVVGIDDKGCLLVDFGEGPQPLTSGEISVRAIP